MTKILSMKISGSASKKVIKEISIDLNKYDENISLMKFLHLQNIPIASSCNGEGVCSKCIVNNNLLTCQITLQDFLRSSKEAAISISYL